MWSPDGEQVAFSVGGAEVRVKNVDGGSPPRPVTRERGIVARDWHPGGAHLLASAVTGGELKLDLLAVPVSGDEAPRPVMSTPANEFGGRFSPDGQWLAVLSDQSGRPEIYVVRFPDPGGKWQLSPDGASARAPDRAPEWLHDGSGIIYEAADGNLVQVSFAVEGASPRIGAASTLFGGRFGELELEGWDLAPDGERILAAVRLRQEGSPTLTLVSNWAAELEPSR